MADLIDLAREENDKLLRNMESLMGSIPTGDRSKVCDLLRTIRARQAINPRYATETINYLLEKYDKS